MRKYLLIILSLLIFQGLGQNFVMTWDQCYGGTIDDWVRSIIPHQNGYIFFGSTRSQDGDISNNPEAHSAWLVQIDFQGNIIKDVCYPGNDFNNGFKILPIENSQFYLFGISDHMMGESFGYWFARIDSNYNLIWQKTFGGSMGETSRGACISHTGGIIGAGLTNSSDGDIEEHFGFTDNWIVSVNPNGEKEWVKTYGNLKPESGGAIIPTSDGGYILCASGQNYKPGNIYCEGHDNMNLEAWLIKMDSAGQLEWHQCYGGSENDYFKDIIELEDGYIILGSSKSGNGDLPGHYGMSGESTDIWIMRTDLNGNMLWSKNYGGSDWDWGYRIFQNNNGFTVFGTTTSNDYDVQGNSVQTNADIVWMFQVDDQGELIYQKPFDEIYPLSDFPDFLKTSEYKYMAAITRRSHGCYHTYPDINSDIYVFEIQDMDEYIPEQPNGPDEICLDNSTETYYSTQLVLDSMETQWLLEPEEAGNLLPLHDSVLIQWDTTYTDTAWLKVKALNEYGESSYSTAKQIIVKDCTGLGEISQKQLKTYPNPAHTRITFELPIITKESTLIISDVFGKTVIEISPVKGQAQIIWDCSQISNGVYFYCIEINGALYNGKILVQK